MNWFSSIQYIQWREPLWLLLTLQPFLIFLFKRLLQQNNLSLFADKKLHAWLVYPYRLQAKNILSSIFSKNTAYILAWTLFSIALAGPRVAQTSNESIAQGANIMLVVDISRSMQATDIMPNRLRRAKIEIYELLEKAHGHRIGIIVFAARPHLFVPLTTDHKALKSYLDILDDLQLPTLGSDPISAILLASEKLKNFNSPSAIILLTDGDLTSKTINEDINKLDKLKSQNTSLYILGLGSVEGEAIQLSDGNWLKNNGKAVISKMQEKTLTSLAKALSGRYSPVYENDADWNVLYQDGIKKIPLEITSATHTKTQYKELFIYSLLPSLILFLISLSPYSIKTVNRIIPLFFICSFFSYPSNDAFAFELIKTPEQKAYDAFDHGDFALSEKYFKQMQGYKGYLGQANSLYRRGHYQSSIPKFTQAVLHARSDIQRAVVLFNLANAYFRTGDFSKAIDTYKDVLRYSPNHKESLYNIGISEVLKKNIELRNKEEQEILAARRQGRGPRSAESAQNDTINENTSVSIGSATNTPASKIPLPELPGLSEDVIKKLIFTGLESIKLADNNLYKSKQNTEYNTKMHFNIDKHINSLTYNKHLLWKRIFEIEEGFPAPVEEAKKLPGIEPW